MWETPTKGQLGFNDLVIALQEHWLVVASKFPNVEDIKVIGIDLTKRGGAAAIKTSKPIRRRLARRVMNEEIKNWNISYWCTSH
jgi:hypothetical protein